MTKKKIIKEKERKKLKKHFFVSAYTLEIGEWRNEYPHDQCKRIIAEALNDTVHKKEMIIVGYLITEQKLYLVLRMEPATIHEAFRKFYEKVSAAIRWHLEDAERTYKTDTNLFERRPLLDTYLIRLLTGRKMSLPYYDPYLERLKAKLRHYNFCSVIDYAGGEGPVAVSLLSLSGLGLRHRLKEGEVHV